MANTKEAYYLEITGSHTFGSRPIAVYPIDTSPVRFRVATEIDEGSRTRLHVIYKSRQSLSELLKTFRDSGCAFREVTGPDPYPAAHSS